VFYMFPAGGGLFAHWARWMALLDYTQNLILRRILSEGGPFRRKKTPLIIEAT